MGTKSILLKDILKDNNYPHAGSIVFDKAKEAIIDGDQLVIDMEDIPSVPTSFMNTSFGDLINLFGIDETKKIFYFKNIRKTQMERFRKYFEDYKEILNNQKD